MWGGRESGPRPPHGQLTLKFRPDEGDFDDLHSGAALEKLFAMALALVGPRPADSPKQMQLKPGQRSSPSAIRSRQEGGYLRNVDAVLAQQYPD